MAKYQLFIDKSLTILLVLATILLSTEYQAIKLKEADIKDVAEEKP